ncbi:hypothetical protein SETIT_2G069600v2 [Setaria italica]|uniref:Uncharacterized protein n=1 Tax=Setaria italica TaxID=4555 RepID=A0A368PVV2_SETIT|nr:hypothetical protein SETIT_2G069600v2 [Setaria italica]
MASRPRPSLPDELVEAILLRIPPDYPARLMRAAVACKRWRRLVTGPAFRRGFRRAHRTPPVLGVLRNSRPRGMPTVSFSPACSFLRTARGDCRAFRAIDSRHGRLRNLTSLWRLPFHNFAVWNPITDELRNLTSLWRLPCRMSIFNAAVLCAGGGGEGGGCDHLDCHHRGPFLVVFVATNGERMFSYVYSSEADAWSESTSAPCLGKLCQSTRGALVEKENSLYLVLEITPRILRYNLGTREVTLVDAPPMTNTRIVLMTADGGGLGCATVEGSELCLWSREVVPDGDSRWALGKAIRLSTLMPAGRSMRDVLDVVGSVDGGAVVFVRMDRGEALATNLKSGCFKQSIPYMSFYTPALPMAGDEDPRSGEPAALSNKVGASICEMAPEVLSNEALSSEKEPVETIGQSKATGEDKEARDDNSEDKRNKRAKR